MNRLAPQGLADVTVKGGPSADLRLRIVPGSEKYYWTGDHERDVQQRVAALQPGQVFWDVGAHIGLMSLIAARRVGREGAVVAFEPVPGNAERLRANLALNGAENVTVIGSAVAAQPGSMTMYSRSGVSLMWTLEQENVGDERLDVEVTTLDRVLDTAPYPDLIKIDTEGVEVDVLRGASRLLADARARFLVEFTDDERVQQARELAPSYRFDFVSDRHWLMVPR
ncbi:FkbM family methyltransferase [Paraconexibacter sp.]|uniref:FkbM family methyltransferase n=1 Tax=Paraconexibacter sp. TaxID=2949640 RepID=UPI00356246C6